MAITLVRQELFDPSISGITTYDSSHTGSFDFVVGSVVASKIGPKSTTLTSSAGQGWSGKITSWSSNRQCYGAFGFNDASGIASCGMMSGWFNLWKDSSQGISDSTLLMDFRSSPPSGGSVFGGVITFGGNLFSYIGPAQINTGSAILPAHKWAWVAVAWFRVANNNRVFKVFTKGINDVTASLLTTFTSLFNSDGQPYTASFGVQSQGGGSKAIARFGGASLYSMDSASFAHLPAAFNFDLIDPPQGPYNWYVSQGGNDSNDGLTPTSSWQTVSKLNTESNFYQGVFGTWHTSSADSVGMGDRIIIDSTQAPLELIDQGISLNKDGLVLTSIQSSSFVDGSTSSYAVLKPWETIPNASWSLVPGKTKTYQFTYPTSSFPSGTIGPIYIWEDDKWMNQFTGNSYNAISASMETTTGSFFCDSFQTVYVHPFGDTNPTTDGKSYTRSRMLYWFGQSASVNAGWSAIDIGDNGTPTKILVEQMFTKKTTTLPQDVWPSYGLQIFTGAGDILTRNCYFTYAGKHVCGVTTNSSLTLQATFSKVQAEQSHPNTVNTFIVFGGNSTTASNKVLFDRCVTLSASGQFGSSLGTFGDAMYGHGNPNTFDTVSIDGCNFSGGDIVCFGGTTQNIIITNTTCSGFVQMSNTTSIDRCIIGLPNVGYNTIGFVKNSIIQPNNMVYQGNDINNISISGSGTFTNCTFDMRKWPTVQLSPYFGLWRYSGGTLSFINNIFIGSSSISLFGAFPSGSMYSDYNAYFFNTASIASGSMGLKGTSSFAQWQATGQDVHSNVYTSLAQLSLDPTTYIPQAGSPVINAGSQSFNYTDMTGQTFLTRTTLGAWEFVATAISVLELARRQGGPAPSMAQTVNNVMRMQPQTVNDTVLHEHKNVFEDPYILSLMEELDLLYARNRGKRTQSEFVKEQEIIAAIQAKMNR